MNKVDESEMLVEEVAAIFDANIEGSAIHMPAALWLQASQGGPIGAPERFLSACQ